MVHYNNSEKRENIKNGYHCNNKQSHTFNKGIRTSDTSYFFAIHSSEPAIKHKTMNENTNLKKKLTGKQK